jgi:predicted P-loop ATPase
VPPKLRIIVGHTGNLEDLNYDLNEKKLLRKNYRSWSEVAFALAAVLKKCNYTPEQIAEALLADLPCNRHIADQDDKKRAIERTNRRSYAPERTFDPAGNWPGGQDEETGHPNKDILNTIEAIKWLEITCMFDEFRQKEYWTGHANKVFDGEVGDAAVTVVRVSIRSQFNFYPNKQDAQDAITSACHDNRRNPVLEYYKGLKWDGKPRLNTMLHRYYGAENTQLNAAMGRKFMCAIIRRSKQPGCKFDHRLVMQGQQKIRKSMACEDMAVFPDLYTDAGDLSLDIKQQMEIGQGKQIIEFPENVGASRKNRDRTKANISRKSGRARMAYAHYATDIPYQWVGIITKNPGGYLNDPTGERRYWHVEVTFYDREAFLADKDQLYAEAVALEPNENLWLDTPELEAAHDALVAGEKEPNALVEMLAELRGEVWTVNGKQEERVSVADIRVYLGLINIELVRFQDIGVRIAEAMMALGWTKAKKNLRSHKGQAPAAGYRRPWIEPQPSTAQDDDEGTPVEKEQAPTGIAPSPQKSQVKREPSAAPPQWTPPEGEA